jgi:hypothetical protein
VSVKISREEWIAAACVAAVGAVCLALNWSQPLVRNGIVYARAAEHILEHSFNALPVVADSKLSYDKPIGFAWLASPLVQWLGTHHGLMLASLLGTCAYIAAVAWFARAFDPFAASSRERACVVALAALSPIVAYQFWSAHPDSLFAALYLAAFALTHGIVQRPSLVRVALLAAAIFASLMLKNYGMILLPSCSLYLLWHRRRVFAAPGGRIVAAASALAIAVLFALVVLGRTGHNALMRIDGEGGGFAQYGRGSWWLSCVGTLVQVGIALAINLHVALPWTFRARRPASTSSSPSMLSALISFPLVYVAGLMLFPTTFYNMRYFVPLLPFAALLAVVGLRASTAPLQRVVRTSFVIAALALIAIFDCAPLYRRVAPAIPTLEVNWIGVPLSLLDNLRMSQHIAQAEWIDNLNEHAEPGSVVYMLDVDYYRDAQRGVFERAGLIRGDIETRYASSRGFEPEGKHFYVQANLRDSQALDRLSAVADLGHGLYEVTASN